MSNYPDTDERLEKSLSELWKTVNRLVRQFEDLKKEVGPAVTAQRIRDNWDGI